MNKKLSKASMKPLDFGCILKLSKSQLLEGGSKDAAIEGVYGGVLAYLSHNSHKIAFPELAVPVVMQLREFLKRCKVCVEFSSTHVSVFIAKNPQFQVANYCRKMKQLLEKIEENSKFLLIQRGKVTFGVMDTDKFKSWEAQVGKKCLRNNVGLVETPITLPKSLKTPNRYLSMSRQTLYVYFCN